jgi:hypothetical protein
MDQTEKVPKWFSVPLTPLTTSDLGASLAMTAYIRQLNALLTADPPQSQPMGLRQRFLDWHNGLPEFTRNRPIAMSELEAVLTTQGRYISPLLLELGWRRKRIWNTAGHYHRYWLPPG